jgi:hypothetical protein
MVAENQAWVREYTHRISSAGRCVLLSGEAGCFFSDADKQPESTEIFFHHNGSTILVKKKRAKPKTIPEMRAVFRRMVPDVD